MVQDVSENPESGRVAGTQALAFAVHRTGRVCNLLFIPAIRLEFELTPGLDPALGHDPSRAVAAA